MSVITAQVQSKTHRRRSSLWGSVVGIAVRGATGLPLAVAAIPMALIGAAGPAARAQRGMVRRFHPQRAGESAPKAGAVRVIVHSLLVILPALASFAAVCVAAFTAFSGYLYFLRPDASFALGHPFTADHRFDQSWGGPTLVGAWFVHSAVALGLQLVLLALVHVLTAVQDRATRRLLGS